MLPGSIQAVWTGTTEGDLGTGAVDNQLESRRRAVVDRPWSFLRQGHGPDVFVVSQPGEGVGHTGDALVSAHSGACLAVFTADCAPLALASPEGVMGAAHAGWRGLSCGVIERAVATMQELGATRIQAALGPCIHAECYEFSVEELENLASRLGPSVASCTSSGTPALDIPAAVRSAVETAGAELVWSDPACTACSGSHFSFRARRNSERQALVMWRA